MCEGPGPWKKPVSWKHVGKIFEKRLKAMLLVSTLFDLNIVFLGFNGATAAEASKHIETTLKSDDKFSAQHWWTKTLTLNFAEAELVKLFPSLGAWSLPDTMKVVVLARSDFALLRNRQRANSQCTTRSATYKDVPMKFPWMMPVLEAELRRQIWQGCVADSNTVIQLSRPYARLPKQIRDVLVCNFMALHEEWCAVF